MYLKQVELENFKSFGGKLTIPLMEGYMAVTGPNGSGKSNITDAILFVLGPKSSKAVRAGKLTDLIFDGGKAKTKAGFTKVSLVFDNSDRLMPWDDDVVRLTRYVKISDNGTDYNSYFYINDRKSSLTEFDGLLTKARISADGYNMVQQGDVTRIVQMGNLERRRVLDSISGISSYDDDLDKANGERTEAVTNLERINIVVGELENDIKKLEKDREDAKKYLETQSNLEMAKAQLIHRHFQIEQSKLESTFGQMASLTAEIEALTLKKGALKLENEENEKKIIAKEEEIAEKIGPEYRQLKEKIESTKIKLATQKDRVERASEDKDEQIGFKTNFEESIDDNLIERKAATESLADIVIKLEEHQNRLEEAKAESASISEEMAKHGGEHTILQNNLSKLEIDIDAKETEEHDIQVRCAKAETIAEESHRSQASLDERLQSAAFDIKDAEWNIQQVKQEAGPMGTTEELSKKILETRKKEAEYEKQENELKEIIRRLDGEYNELMAEKRVSDRMNRGSAAVSAILELRDKGQMLGIHGTIQELATVDSVYETALAVAAGSKMQAIVVNDDQVAADCINFLKKEKLGRVTFLPLTKMIPGKPRAKAIMIVKQTEGYATDLIDYDVKYQNAFWYVFQDTLVVDNISNARSMMGGVRLVTKSGELIEASGAMVGGTINPQNIMKFGASSEDKLEESGSKLRGANASLDAVRAQLKEIRDSIRAMDDEMRKTSQSGIGAQAKMGQLNAQISELKKIKQALSDEFNIKRNECNAAEKELDKARSDLAFISEVVENLRNERTNVRERIAMIAPAEIQERIQKVRDNIYKLKIDVADLESQRTGLETEISGLDKQKESLDIQLRSVLKKISDDDEIINKYEKELESLKIELNALKSIEKEMEGGIEDLRIQKDSLIENRYRLDGDKTSTQEKIETKTGLKQSQEAQIAIINENIRQLNEELAAIKIEVKQPIPSEEEIKRIIRSCENIMSRLGNVNLRAIEDYDEKKKRYDGLMSDVATLNKQIKELDDLTQSLNAQKKGLFMKSYEAVNTNFHDIYTQLSGGGEAYMGLENEDDPFSGGLMINAKPKNGKLLRLEALSGGEKSLTALAFIFAIQEYQPSPFYVLDEVDMFLDAVNAEMVAKRIKESSLRAQFIQVSLRKVTLVMADHLIGVTRPPSGISKVIMQPDLAEVSKYEEEANKKHDSESVNTMHNHEE
ncbi:MAG: chromosome segregation protein SMC [Candidatus Methanomethylophilaceae archaeon]|nr:chromosome segregation protein SMC [Candidatus Methanomethylophilaceae archaeon]MDD3378398.1 chromosome segregation protein SMC [Candidatus Methanomethylophilaceae archaeon]MDY0224013.1 chromosome segregation protein SMC [Candidatus Methanomethylophilaceae archaeon]